MRVSFFNLKNLCCMCVYPLVCIVIHTCVCKCMWRPGDTLMLSLQVLLFLRQGLSLSFSSPSSLGCLASNLETACLCFLSTGITKEVLVQSLILWFLGTELRSCNLYYIHFMIELFSQSHLSQKLKTLTKIHFLGGVYYSRIS